MAFRGANRRLQTPVGGRPSIRLVTPHERLNLPALVVTGLQDHVFHNEADVVKLTARIALAKRINLPEAGRLIPGERPAELLIRFAEEV